MPKSTGSVATLSSGPACIHPDTPIPHADVALRLFRKFARKTRPFISDAYGGSKSATFFQYFFSSSTAADDAAAKRKYTPYQELLECIAKEDDADDPYDEKGASHNTTESNDAAAINAIMGQSGDTQEKAGAAVAAFGHLCKVWSNASASMAETAREAGTDAHAEFSRLLSWALDTATALVTHGCFDGVDLVIMKSSGGEETDADTVDSMSHSKTIPVVHVLAECVFSADLIMECMELSAMKFLLSTGCRGGAPMKNGSAAAESGGEANVPSSMLRGTYLLQSIRVLYHIYLTTMIKANQTTARASLQQLVTSVFVRMIASSATSDDGVNGNAALEASMSGMGTPVKSNSVASQPETPASLVGGNDDDIHATSHPHGKEDFPTENHRDAFLVLRSLCKLSMRSPPHDPDRHSHVGLQTSGSNALWDANDSSVVPPGAVSSGAHDGETMTRVHDASSSSASLIYTQAVHPALASKLLALDLLLYVLSNTDMKGSFLLTCGPQFHYAIRNYLCVSLLKNCTMDDTRVVNLSLRVFVPIIRNFRSILKTEIEAFVTNVFFVILDSKNSPIEHKALVVTLFEEICSDPTTLAEIFLNYDCDLSAVDLFHRIVNTLSRVSKSSESDHDAGGITATASSTLSLVAGAGAVRMEKLRRTHRELRLVAMRALRQVLASLHASIVVPMGARIDLSNGGEEKANDETDENAIAAVGADGGNKGGADDAKAESATASKKPAAKNKGPEKQTLVQIYDSKKKRRQEESEVVLRFNQKPSAGIAYAGKCGHVDASDPTDVAGYLLKQKDLLDKTQIGEYLGREPDYQQGFSLKVLHEYVNQMDFTGLQFDDAIRYYLSGFRLPGEAQKIDRIMEKFAERFTEQNPNIFPTADVAFILAFSTIMLNTDLHNPAIKEEKKMTKDGFIRNNRGICDGQDLPSELLLAIYDRIKANPFSLKEDDEARERVGDGAAQGTAPAALSPAAFFGSHYEELDRTKENNFQKERDHIVRTTESLLKRRRGNSISEPGHKSPKRKSATAAPRPVRYVRTEDSGLRDEYVSPMFEVTWGPALAAFSMAIESANGTVGALIAIATDDELEQAAENAAETIEVCLTGFRFAICVAGLCGNNIARDSYMLALTRFSQLGTGVLLEPRHVRCIQTMLGLARSDGELLGSSWEHVFRALSEVNRYHQLFQLLARNDRVAAAAASRRKAKLEDRERKIKQRKARMAEKEASDTLDEASVGSLGASSDGNLSLGETLFSDEDMDFDEDEMDKKEIDEANARTVYEAVSEALIEAIYERSSSLSTNAVKEFVLQLCRVSRMEISHYGGHVGSNANAVDLTQVHYRRHHSLLMNSTSKESEGFHHQQPNIYNLQKLVEVTHYNMDSRPRLVFADIWATVAAHLTSTALQPNPAIAMYAVDSFRQLSIQYLQRDELGSFEFQKRFLKPLESVMSRSDLSTTKELLLKCVERIILMFGSPGGANGGKLRSGWNPILTVIGLAGQDEDAEVAKLGFNMLTRQLAQCLSQTTHAGQSSAGVLLAERFVDLVDALLMFVAGPHEQMSVVSVDHLISLSAFLGDESFALPVVRKRAGTATAVAATAAASSGETEGTPNQALELWWPILLGLSKSIGDERSSMQRKSLEAIFQIISNNFLPKAGSSSDATLQTLQLIFRGILTPVLEFGEVGPGDGRAPETPQDFDRFLTDSKGQSGKDDNKGRHYWLDSIFDQFLDGCIGLCIKYMRATDDDSLSEEIFAMLNTCLLSDSGALAVRGLSRLEQFITSDLKQSSFTDDTWATVSHMLTRCLTVRSLPRKRTQPTQSADAAIEEDAQTGAVTEVEDNEEILEFVSEDSMLADRRFIGANVVMVITSFLDSERFAQSLGLQWRIMMVSGVGAAIRDWEQAAQILRDHKGKIVARGHNPPHYLETSIFSRRAMNRYLLQLASSKDPAATAPVVEDGSKAEPNAQTVIKIQTESQVNAFLAYEAKMANEDKKSSIDAAMFGRLSIIMKEMLAGYSKLPDERLNSMTWLNPVLSSCIHTDNEAIRLAIQKLVKRLH